MIYLCFLVAGLLIGKLAVKQFTRSLDKEPIVSPSSLTTSHIARLAGNSDIRVTHLWWAELIKEEALEYASPATLMSAPRWKTTSNAPKDEKLREAWLMLIKGGAVSRHEAHEIWSPLAKKLEKELIKFEWLPSGENKGMRRLEVGLFLCIVAVCAAIAGSWSLLGTLCFFVPLLLSLGIGLKKAKPMETIQAKTLIKDLKEQYAAAFLAPLPNTLGMVVALHGLSVVEGTPYEEMAQEALPGAYGSSNSYSSGCGSTTMAISSCGSCDGGSSSGGCGGGGCGGGGGCS